jgi:hypothetical protein
MDKIIQALELLEQAQSLLWDVKYSSIDTGSKIDFRIDGLVKILKQEQAIKEQALLSAWGTD